METSIKNDFLSVKLKNAGAELTSIKSIVDQTEYLWQAHKDVWPRHAPVLFPIVGKVADNKYRFQDKEYSLGQHGFARDMDFVLVKSTDNSVCFLLESNENTLQKYPFDFKFYIEYKLEGATLITTYKVVNIGHQTMYFSVGGHPAFNCPLLADETWADYDLIFEKTEPIRRYLIKDGLIDHVAHPVELHQNVLPLHTSLFSADAIVIKNMSSKSIILKSRKSGKFVQMDFDGFPFYGIWTKPGVEKFVCLEPWCGIADSVGFNGDLTQKEGINRLEIGKEFTASYRTIFG